MRFSQKNDTAAGKPLSHAPDRQRETGGQKNAMAGSHGVFKRKGKDNPWPG